MAQIQLGGAEDINLAVKAARNAFDNGPWPRMSGRERGVLLNKFADLLEKNAAELAALETLDNGKPLAMSAAADIPLSVEHYRYYAGMVIEFIQCLLESIYFSLALFLWLLTPSSWLLSISLS